MGSITDRFRLTLCYYFISCEKIDSDFSTFLEQKEVVSVWIKIKIIERMLELAVSVRKDWILIIILYWKSSLQTEIFASLVGPEFRSVETLIKLFNVKQLSRHSGGDIRHNNRNSDVIGLITSFRVAGASFETSSLRVSSLTFKGNYALSIISEQQLSVGHVFYEYRRRHCLQFLFYLVSLLFRSCTKRREQTLKKPLAWILKQFSLAL